MPPKPATQSRTWGTRFDTLPAARADSPQEQDTSGVCNWQPGHSRDASVRRKEEKLPHDASVFVGSLPSNVDQAELSQLLLDHLSEHTEVKNIKVIRDSKGGVCAFVQCEDAPSAAALIQTLQSSSPKPFLGRILRYEPAKAVRTLLISFRTPYRLIRDSLNDGIGVQQVALALPFAMRLWRAKNSKFHNIIYNEEAIEVESRTSSGDPVAGSLREDVVFLHPIVFDGETIYKLARFFGQIEKMAPYQCNEVAADGDADQVWKLQPPPHNSPRSASMSKTCWEIKWDHRDDCVNALMTLRRVPHLTVTWAHQSPAVTSDSRVSSHHIQYDHSTGAQYPLYPRYLSNSGRCESGSWFAKPSTLRAFHRRSSVNSLMVKTRCLTLAAKADDDGGTFQASKNMETDMRNIADDNATATEFPSEDAELSEVSLRDEMKPTVAQAQDWADAEFGARTTEWAACSDNDVDDMDSVDVTRDNSSRADNVSPCQKFDQVASAEKGGSEAQELCIPTTPSLQMSPDTPKTPGPLFPITPTSSASDPKHSDPMIKYFHGARGEGDLDPTTLFVGGLEMYGPSAWDEDRVRAVFTRYGGLESVKIVRPPNACTAFAFVRFNNTESPARAVAEQHNRVYGGRALRVQLRACHPLRTLWKYSRGRGRIHSQPMSPHGIVSHYDHYAFGDGSLGALPMSHDDSQHKSVSTSDTANSQDQDKECLPEFQSAQSRESFGDPVSNNDVPYPDGASQTHPSPPAQLNPTVNPSVDNDNRRDWCVEARPVHTPALSSFESSSGTPVSGTPFQYPLPGGNYFPCPPWIHPYSPYQIPYYPGYPVYPPLGAQMTQAFPTPPGSDVNGLVAGAQFPWPQMGLYGYVPYPAPFPVAQNSEHPHPPLVSQTPTSYGPTENGPAAVVYPSEASNQPSAGHAAPRVQLAQAGHYWAPQLSTMPYPSSGTLSRSYSTTTMPWGSNLGVPTMYPPPQIAPPVSAQSDVNPYHVENTYPGPPRDGHANSVLHPRRRQGMHYENHNAHNLRITHPRSLSGRIPRGMYGSGGSTNIAGQQSQVKTPRSAFGSGDWNHWKR